MILPVLSVILLILIILWVTAFIKSYDSSIKSISTPDYKNILIVFPHPDDEVLTTGGLIQLLRSLNSKVTLYAATKGENGTPTGDFDETLAKKRHEEMMAVGKLLRSNQVIVDDFKDGGLFSQKLKLAERLELLFTELKPDLVITYDLSGMYGHEDHIVLSEIVTSMVEEQFPQTSLWYASMPEKMYAAISLPEHMAKDEEFRNKRTRPTHKIWIGSSIINKVRAVYAHKSQYLSFRKSIPLKLIPMWFFLSTTLYEYFHEVDFKARNEE